MKHTGRQVEDGAEAGLQSCGTSSVNHHHLVDLLWILVSQECTERHTGQAEQKAGYSNQGHLSVWFVVCFFK